MLVGREVAFYLEYKVPGSGREYGVLYIGKGNFFYMILKCIHCDIMQPTLSYL